MIGHPAHLASGKGGDQDGSRGIGYGLVATELAVEIRRRRRRARVVPEQSRAQDFPLFIKRD